MSHPRLSLTILALLFSALTAAAQENPNYVLTHKQTKAPTTPEGKCPDTTPKPPEPPKPWQFKFRVGSLFQFNSSSGVVGQRDGNSQSFGADLHFEANWTGGQHEVKNRLDVSAVFIKTPNLSTFATASNVFEVENIYQYRVVPWAGPFTRVMVTTSPLPGNDLRTNAVQYQYPDGTLSEARTDLHLTDFFTPTTFLETIGGFVNPVREEELDLDFRGGVGARQVIADGQLGVQDKSDTPSIVELVDLHDYVQVGVELIAMARGQYYDKKLQAYLGGEFLLPLVRTKQPGDNRSDFEVIDKRFRLGVAYKIASWATLLYEIRVVHQPQLVDQYQIQNNFGFKASYSIN